MVANALREIIKPDREGDAEIGLSGKAFLRKHY